MFTEKEKDLIIKCVLKCVENFTEEDMDVASSAIAKLSFNGAVAVTNVEIVKDED